jgi:hypothetical protein
VVDAAGSVYVTGETTATGFSTTPCALQTSCAGSAFECNDAFVAKLNPSGTALVYSTYLGGTGADGGLAIALDGADDAYIAGATFSTDFPTSNPIPGACAGMCGSGSGWDAFVTEMNPTGSALVYSTYLGGSSNDLSHAIAVDTSGDAYVTGSTCSTDFPTTPAALETQYHGGDCSYGGDAFVTKLHASGTALLYSTYLGGSGADEANGISVDPSGTAFVTGLTTSTDFPVVNALQSVFGGGFSDAFVARLKVTGSALIYSTYLGGNDVDSGDAIAVDSDGDSYVAGFTSSANFPTTSGVFQATYAGGQDAFVAKVVLDAVTLSPPDLTFSSQAVGTTSSPQTATLTNTGETTLDFTSIVVAGADAGDFAETNTCSTSLPVGASCTISVTFTPAALGARTAAVTITDNAPSSPQTVALSGAGTPPTVT